ncbi:TetR/AcrR family transcriptional regulator [Rhodoferax sp. UBA5149]|uniref:TetR/AcrR family transcriptional regulator n=1 Tax=Rhodoferax sp. UBA5149 TaxID=1947379 RepID=UPI0025F69B51|nr:TetR/AcrR family transcriptional regulator [Rhodoferax sp. UBA5149]
MRYPPGHKQEKRKELLKTSGSLVKEGGFATTGVDALMEAAGVTSGTFYSHFSSKTDLLKALIENELQISRDMWAGNPHETAEEWIDFELDRYLCLSHVKHPQAGCVLPALGAEIARADRSVKLLYEKELLKGTNILSKRLGSESLAWAFICQLVGALVMARAMPSEAGQKMIIESSKQFLKRAISDIAAPAPRIVSKRRT